MDVESVSKASIPLLSSATVPIDLMRQRHLSAVVEAGWFNILVQVVASILLFLLIFGMSATVDTTHVRNQLHNKLAILTGVCCQFIVMPLLGFLAVKLLNGQGLTEPMAVSLLIVTASPGGSYSNWWCR